MEKLEENGEQHYEFWFEGVSEKLISFSNL